MKVIKRIILYTLLAIGALVMVFPFFWMLLSSVKTAAEVNTMPPTFWPADPVFENYAFAFSKAPVRDLFCQFGNCNGGMRGYYHVHHNPGGLCILKA